jgi:DNA-binding beta-propeller fold protein YncE
MRRATMTMLIVFAAAGTLRAQAPSYHVARRFNAGGEGGWDYPLVDTARGRIFLSRGTHVMVLGADSGNVLFDITGTPGVHGIAVAPELNKGFISNGRDSSMTIFDYTSLATTANVKVGGANPDAILYDPFSRRVFTFNGRSANASAIDAATNQLLGLVPLGGKPEFAQTDLAGRIWVNIEDSSQVAVFDARTLRVIAKYALAPCEEPSGLAIDREHHRLFAVCSNKLMVVVNTDDGRVVASVAIGEGTDGVAFDPATGLAFAACGEGVVSVVHEDAPDRYSLVATIPTLRGARTITLDPRTHRLYTPTAQFAPAPEPAAGQARQRPAMVPGSFTVLVLER